MGKHRAPRRAKKQTAVAIPTVVAIPRILVVEDDPEAALFTVHVLTTRGQFEVVHTADPAEALRLVTDEHWDLLLTDLEMPGMTGLELLAALRQVAPVLPVAVTSAHALDGTLASLLGHADEYLEKPLRVDKLIATATALIGQGRRPASGSAGL
jgi:CheY-like chemotaxis protein